MKIYSPCTARLLVLLLVGAMSPVALQLANAQASPRKPGIPKRIVADYDYGSKSLTPPYSSAQIPYSRLTHINHAGVPWASDGSLVVANGFLEPELIQKAHAAGVKVLLLTGGDFTAAESDSSVLDAVVANLQIFVAANDYDGLDVDWEFPQSPADAAFFVKLMTRFREVFPAPRYTLSIDVAPWNVPNYEAVTMQKQIDYFNLMVYDCAGPWTTIGHLNSPIFWDSNDPRAAECEPGGSDQEAATMFLRIVPASQLNMGTPFYGYYYPDITQLFGVCPGGSCSSAVAENYGPYIKQLVNQQGWQRYYDPVSWVPYLLQTDGTPGFITYDDARSTYLRVWYSDWVRGLGGTFMWSLDADYDGHSQDLLEAMYKASVKNQ
jgi:chitinase